MNEFIELCRYETEQDWAIVTNSRFDSFSQEGIAVQLMKNPANEYAEYKNCRVIYRVIRAKDLSQYKIIEQ